MKDLREKIRIPALLFLLALVAEVFLFQFRFWTEAGSEPVTVDPAFCVFQTEPEWLFPDAEATGTEGLRKAVLRDTDGSNLFQLDLRGVNMPVRTIRIEAECTDGQESWRSRSGEIYAELDSKAVWAKVLLTEGEEMHLLPDRMLTAGAENSIRIPDTGSLQTITVLLNGVKGHAVLLKSITLNARAGFRFCAGRLFGVYCLLLFFWAFRPGSVLWNRSILDKEGKMEKDMRYTIVGVLFFLIPLILVLLRNNSVYLQSEGGFAFYRELAHALAGGHTDIALQPSAELMAMEDPYDPVTRLEQEVPFYLDYAFYQGKYYVYFGVIPCLLFYLPLYLFFGIDVPGWMILSGLVWLVCLGNALLLQAMTKRYRPDLSQASFLLLWVAVTAVLSLPAVLGDACNYLIPQLSGVAFFLYGMLFYYQAAQKAKRGAAACAELAVASLLMAFTAGARPQMVFGAVAVLPLILPLLFPKEPEGKRKFHWRRILCFCLPYLFTAGGLMAYNYVRFGSFTEFGTRYNLTFAYVNTGEFHPETIGAGIFYYLLRPFHIGELYPYLQRTSLVWSNPGLLASHPSVGGLYFLYPILFGGVFVLRRPSMDREGTMVGRLLLLLVPLIAAADACMGGLMDRYKMDFAVFAAFAMSLGVLGISNGGKQGKTAVAVRLAGMFLVAAALLISSLSYGMEGVSSLLQVNPEVWASISGAITFWR